MDSHERDDSSLTPGRVIAVAALIALVALVGFAMFGGAPYKVTAVFENGGAYVVITHDIMSARRVADYIAVLWKGRIVESGPASELFNSDNQFVRQFLSGEARGPLGME